MDRSRSHGLDGLRGYAALAVVVYHSILGLDGSQVSRLVRPTFFSVEGLYSLFSKFFLVLFNGETAVAIFFTLSGLVLFRSLERRRSDSLRAGLAFLVRRFFRIYPTFLACLTICLVVFSRAGISRTTSDFIDNALLWRFPIHGASWTLQVELLAAPYVLASYFGYRRYGVRGLVGMFILAMAMLAAIATKDRFYAMKAYLPCFFIGMLVSLPIGEAAVRRLPQWAWLPLLAASLLSRHVIANGSTAQLVEYAAIGLLVSLIYHRRGGWLQIAMERPFSQFLGRISYSLYLFNVVVMEVAQELLRDHTAAGRHPLEYGLASSLFIAAASIPLAALGERHIERPTDAWGHAIARRIVKSGPVVERPPKAALAALPEE
jgi:peptidoglycan/LPS O-acetylase OafA/YrhL